MYNKLSDYCGSFQNLNSHYERFVKFVTLRQE